MANGLYVHSEIGPLKKVLLHRPGKELLNLTPDDLSRLFKIPPHTIERWERGELTPPAWVEQLIRRRMEIERQNTRQKGNSRRAATDTKRR